MTRKLLVVTVLLLIQFFAFAQDSAQGAVDMADSMRSSGKIFVVIAVILTIFAGIIFYLIRLDRKITRLEKEVSE
ncbi:CcmD family protein [Paraflavisolibacter sp. H34]|uniref:CcmD family protein n=1 Tax=Huijunlia imazamoxiresistens TaxID=3127457 RepID=UPI003015B089